MKFSKFKVTLLTFALFATLFFFGYNIITGRIYSGAANDNSYISFMMIVDVIPLLFFIIYLRSGLSKKNVVPIVLVLVIFLVVTLLGSGVNDINFKSLMAFSIPAALIGILIAKSNSGPYFAKLLELLMLFLTVTGIVSMKYILSVSTLREVGSEGIGINSLSYYCGFAFALNLYFLLFGDELPDRFNYAKTTLYKYISILLLVIQFVVGLSSGGRGGFVLLLVSAVVLVFIRIRRRNGRSFKTLFTFVLLIIVSILAVQYMPRNIGEAINRGSLRTFSYISESGVDASETSGRDKVYEEAIKAIQDSPIIGHGLLMRGTLFYGERPHNIFLEVLIQGGIIYLTVFLVLIIHLIRKMSKLIKHGHGLYMIPVALYPLVMLMFSASYVGNDLFWFVISYIICCDAPKKRLYLLKKNKKPFQTQMIEQNTM